MQTHWQTERRVDVKQKSHEHNNVVVRKTDRQVLGLFRKLDSYSLWGQNSMPNSYSVFGRRVYRSDRQRIVTWHLFLHVLSNVIYSYIVPSSPTAWWYFLQLSNNYSVHVHVLTVLTCRVCPTYTHLNTTNIQNDINPGKHNCAIHFNIERNKFKLLLLSLTKIVSLVLALVFFN